MPIRRYLIATLALSLLLIAAPVGAAFDVEPGGTFFDDDGNIFEADIEGLAAAGVTTGCNPERTDFCPNGRVTRGQMAAFLVRALPLTEHDDSIDFTDDNDSIFETDIEKLATAGVTTGCGGVGTTTFCPNDSVTRGQMAAFLVRALNLTESDPAIDFDDDNDSIFEADIEKLATAGITTGCGGNAFCPNNPVTRGQMAAFLVRALKYDKPVTVEARPATINGIWFDTNAPYLDGTCGSGAVCTFSTTQPVGEFFLYEFWFTEGWSFAPTSFKNDFLSDKFRVDAYLNGTGLDMAVSTELINDIMYKDFTFQFPSFLTGTHLIVIEFIDETANGLELTINGTVTFDGVGTASLSFSEPAQPRERSGGRQAND